MSVAGHFRPFRAAAPMIACECPGMVVGGQTRMARPFRNLNGGAEKDPT
jgi:hypothetical protein